MSYKKISTLCENCENPVSVFISPRGKAAYLDSDNLPWSGNPLSLGPCTGCSRVIVHLNGQSNACGRADLPSGQASNLLLPDDSTVSDTNPAPNDVASDYGLEMFLSCLGGDCPAYLVKTCKGGGADGSGSAPFILDLMNAEHFPQSQPLSTVADGECPARHIAIWVQGEYEALRDPEYIDYEQKEAAVFDAYIANHPNIEIISVLLNEDINRPFTSQINQAKLNNEAAYSQVTTIGPYPLGPDGLHYDEIGLSAIAQDVCSII